MSVTVGGDSDAGTGIVIHSEEKCEIVLSLKSMVHNGHCHQQTKTLASVNEEN